MRSCTSTRKQVAASRLHPAIQYSHAIIQDSSGDNRVNMLFRYKIHGPNGLVVDSPMRSRELNSTLGGPFQMEIFCDPIGRTPYISRSIPNFNWLWMLLLLPSIKQSSPSSWLVIIWEDWQATAHQKPWNSVHRARWGNKTKVCNQEFLGEEECYMIRERHPQNLALPFFSFSWEKTEKMLNRNPTKVVSMSFQISFIVFSMMPFLHV